ncbi:MAG: hypothetical protein D6734_08725 [Candidatus Schekmanbacteria bacterium]|nr:MAG: hypothetical protein D6734_08725 [Candidatus Schekmanbacteria bacterium]
MESLCLISKFNKRGKGVKSAFGFSCHFQREIQQIHIFPKDLDNVHGFYLAILQGKISRSGGGGIF